MRLLAQSFSDRSPIELAAIEATNNRRAVRELRAALRLAIDYLQAYGADEFKGENERMAAYCYEKLKQTTPRKIAGRVQRGKR